MIPFTVEIKGRKEPIDAKKVAFGTYNNNTFAYLVTVDNRIASVKKEDINVFWQNEPTKKDFEHIDRMIREGKDIENIDTPDYKGMETV